VKYTCFGKAHTLYILHDKFIRHSEIILDAVHVMWRYCNSPKSFCDCIAECTLYNNIIRSSNVPTSINNP
jgi:hypothetical protein